MKLQQILLSIFLVLTIVPVCIVLILFYNSGYQLSMESYARNLEESIHVQVDYIGQSLESHMTSDYRFANNNVNLIANETLSQDEIQQELLVQFGNYLDRSEDKITACILLDSSEKQVYSIGEQAVLEFVYANIATISVESQSQSIVELEIGEDLYSLAILTPVWGNDGSFKGSLVSVYDRSYLFKIISSYYEIAESETYLSRQDGTVINARGMANQQQEAEIQHAFTQIEFEDSGLMNVKLESRSVLGYYQKIHSSPWYLVGIIDQVQIYDFLNQFIWVYIFFILLIVMLDILLAAYLSSKTIKPINELIQMIDGYPESLEDKNLQDIQNTGYFETRYLRTKFLNLMRTILRVQHNFEGVYKLYQSSAMDDTNIDIDVKQQTITSNKEYFTNLMKAIELSEDVCIVHRFSRCFCERDATALMTILEGMRDEQLSVATETEAFISQLDERWFHVLIVPMYEDDRLSRLFIQLRDITVFKKQEQQSLILTKYDTLLPTIYNRIGFMEQVTLALESLTSCGAILFLDLDNFKMVNDNFGHSVGDEILQSVAEKLLSIVGDNGIVSRFGGDEFCIFLPNTDEHKSEEMCQKVTQEVQYAMENETVSFSVLTSIGSAIIYPDRVVTLEQILIEADMAMYKVKRSHKKAQQVL